MFRGAGGVQFGTVLGQEDADDALRDHHAVVFFLPPIVPGLPRKEFQEKMERMISEEASRLIGADEAKVAREPAMR